MCVWGGRGLTSMVMMKAIFAARMCQKCMVCVYSLSWPGG